MALPVVLTVENDAAIRRVVIVFGLWVADLALEGFKGRSVDLAHAQRKAVINGTMDQLAIQPGEIKTLEQYRAASQRFSFLDHRAANWVFGDEVAESSRVEAISRSPRPRQLGQFMP